MNLLFILLGFVFLAGVMFFMSKILGRGNEKDEKKEVAKMPYRLRNTVFNGSEQALYVELKKQLGDRYEIFTKVRIIDFVEVPKGSNNYAKWRNKIWAKHVDFLLCDKNFKPVIAVELDGKSHLKESRVKRDEFVKGVYEKVGVRFERVLVGDIFSDSVSKIVLHKD